MKTILAIITVLFVTLLVSVATVQRTSSTDRELMNAIVQMKSDLNAIGTSQQEMAKDIVLIKNVLQLKLTLKGGAQ